MQPVHAGWGQGACKTERLVRLVLPSTTDCHCSRQKVTLANLQKQHKSVQARHFYGKEGLRVTEAAAPQTQRHLTSSGPQTQLTRAKTATQVSLPYVLSATSLQANMGNASSSARRARPDKFACVRCDHAPERLQYSATRRTKIPPRPAILA